MHLVDVRGQCHLLFGAAPKHHDDVLHRQAVINAAAVELGAGERVDAALKRSVHVIIHLFGDAGNCQGRAIGGREAGRRPWGC